jgi:hypothetical protein
VLTNQNGSPVPSIVRNIISDRMLGLKYFDWETYLKSKNDSAKVHDKVAAEKKVAEKNAMTKPSHEPQNYEGNYNNPGYGTFSISIKNDSFFVATPRMVLWMKHKNYDVFSLWPIDEKDGLDTTGSSFPIQFNTNLSGDIESASLELEASVKPIVFTRSGQEVAKNILASYTGEYEIGSVTIKIYTKGDKGLFMLVPGQPEYDLIPLEKDKFKLKSLSGYSVEFIRNEKNEITGVNLIQPNGTFKATRKK